MTPKHLKYPLVRTITTGAFASLALLAACEAKLPTSDEMDRMTASTATQSAGRAALIDTLNVNYYVDGVLVTKADADKLDADAIASVNVMKRSDRGGEVRIATRVPGDTTIGRKRKLVIDSVVIVEPGAGSNAQVRSRTGFTGLMIVDGVITEASVANSIAPDQIVSVNVIKGAAATAQYRDARAANGVIQITTKKAKP